MKFTDHTKGMIAQARKSRSNKQYRVVTTSIVGDMEKFNNANATRGNRYEPTTLYQSQAIASLRSKSITDTRRLLHHRINRKGMHMGSTNSWGYKMLGFIVYDAHNDTLLIEEWAS